MTFQNWLGLNHLVMKAKLLLGSLKEKQSKLMQIMLSNREWPFLRLEYSGRIPTITLIARYMISEIDDARCIVADL